MFISRDSIEAALADRGLALRAPRLDDMPALCALHDAAYPNRRPEQLMSDQFLYRLIEYGRSIVLHDAQGELLGYHLVFHVLHQEKPREPLALSCGLVVHRKLEGSNIGGLVFNHTAWRSMAEGARGLEGTVKTTNFASLSILLNKTGAVAEYFLPRLGASRGSFFNFRLELSERSLGRPAIHHMKLKEFIHGGRPGVDFQIVDAGDVEGLAAIYDESEMQVMAVAPPGLIAEGTVLVAFPKSALEGVDAELRGYP